MQIQHPTAVMIARAATALDEDGEMEHGGSFTWLGELLKPRGVYK